MSTTNEIYDYVMNNPQDTNGSVLNSLLNTLETGSDDVPDIVGVVDFEENTITFPEEITYKYLKENLPQAKIGFYAEGYGEETYYYLSLFGKIEDGGEYYIYKFENSIYFDLPSSFFFLIFNMSGVDTPVGTLELRFPEEEDNSLITLYAGTDITEDGRFSYFVDLPDGVTQQFIYENAERITICCALYQEEAPAVNLTLMERWVDYSEHIYATFHGKTNEFADNETDIYLVFDGENTDEEIYVPQIVETAGPPITISFDKNDMELDEDGYITNEDVIAQLNTARVGDVFMLAGTSKTYMPATFLEAGGSIVCVNICINNSLQIEGLYSIIEVGYGTWVFNCMGEE